MPVQRPEDLHPAFQQAFNAGNVDAVLKFYEPGATLVGDPAKPATGTEALREAMGEFLVLKPVIQVETKTVVRLGDLAFLSGKWSLKGTAPDGTEVEMSGQSAEVARRQADGSWLYVIDLPFGTG